MEKESKTTQEMMSIGELAKKMNVTVRTLQYYDKIGLLTPSIVTPAKKRYYTYKDMIQLHQILSLKSLGFSLNEIKNHLISLNTPDEFAAALTHQSHVIQEKIKQLSASYQAIDALKKEVLQMQQVNFKKYADIIVNLQMNNEYYWLIKHFDDQLMDHIRTRFDQESGIDFMNRFNELNQKMLELQEKQVDVREERVQKLTGDFWHLVNEFTDGDDSLLPQLIAFASQADQSNEWMANQAKINAYLEKAMEVYFANRERENNE